MSELIISSDRNNTVTSPVSAIAPGTIAITSGDAASQQTVDTISRDTASANDGAITRDYDDAKREEIALGFEATRMLAGETATFFANRAAEQKAKKEAAEHKDKELAAGVRLGADGKPLLDANNNPIPLTQAERQLYSGDKNVEGSIANLKDDAAKLNSTWGATSPARIIATALNGAAGSNVTGSMSSFVQATAVNVLQSLAVQQVKGIADSAQTMTVDADGKKTYTPNAQSEAIRAALQAVVGCGGAAAGGSNGCNSAAAGAGASVLINYLLTEFVDPQPKDGPRSLEDQEARKNLVTTIIATIASASGMDTNAATIAAQIETENNDLKWVAVSNLTLAEARDSLVKAKAQIAAHPEDSEDSKKAAASLEAYIGHLVTVASAEVSVLNLIQTISDPVKRAEMMALPRAERTRLAEVYIGNPALAEELVNASPAVRAQAYKDIAYYQKNGDSNWLTWAGGKVIGALGLDEKTAAEMYVSDLRYRTGESELHVAIKSAQDAVSRFSDGRRAEVDVAAQKMKADGVSQEQIDAFVLEQNYNIATAESTANSVLGLGRSSLDTLTLAVSEPSLIAKNTAQGLDSLLLDDTPVRVYVERAGKNWEEFKKLSPAEQGRILGDITGKAVTVVGGVIISKKLELPGSNTPDVDAPDAPDTPNSPDRVTGQDTQPINRPPPPPPIPDCLVNPATCRGPDGQWTHWTNPETGKVEPIATAKNYDSKFRIEDDHILPQKDIEAMMEGQNLTSSQRNELLNWTDNLQPLPKPLNCSKGCKDGLDWEALKSQGVKIDPDYRLALSRKQSQVRVAILKKIEALAAQNGGS